MTRLSTLLLIALVAGGLYLVKVSYEARRLFVDLERAKAEEQQLQADERRLEAERRTAATHLRVERVARDKLNMRQANAENTLYVAEKPASGAAQ
ncbi:MAG: cell division protein FtsL [Ideonella sp.]|nr:cell division protein FtsL [Ideonella sp.]